MLVGVVALGVVVFIRFRYDYRVYRPPRNMCLFCLYSKSRMRLLHKKEKGQEYGGRIWISDER